VTGEVEFAVARELYAAFQAGDDERIEAVLAPDAEWHNAPEAIEPGVRRGREAFLNVVAQLRETWDYGDDLRVEVFDAGDDVGVDLFVQISGRGSGVRLPGHFRHYLLVRDGRVVRLRWEVLPDHG
jgi:ketosteroid isomerase-like protein